MHLLGECGWVGEKEMLVGEGSPLLQLLLKGVNIRRKSTLIFCVQLVYGNENE